MLNPTLQCDDIRRPLEGDWVMRVPFSWMELVLLQETESEFSHPSAKWGHIEPGSTYEPGSEFLPDTESASTLLFPISRIVRKTCLLFVSHLAYGILLWQSEQTNTGTFSSLVLERPHLLMSFCLHNPIPTLSPPRAAIFLGKVYTYVQFLYIIANYVLFYVNVF